MYLHAAGHADDRCWTGHCGLHDLADLQETSAVSDRFEHVASVSYPRPSASPGACFAHEVAGATSCQKQPLASCLRVARAASTVSSTSEDTTCKRQSPLPPSHGVIGSHTNWRGVIP